MQQLGVITGEFRLASDPQLRYAQNGTAVANLRLVNGSRKKEGDQWVDDKTLWIDATAFKRTAENIAESLKSGDLVVVIGKAQTETWDDRETGAKRSKIALVIDAIGASLAWKTVELHDSQQSQSGGGGTPAAPANDAPPQSDDPPF